MLTEIYKTGSSEVVPERSMINGIIRASIAFLALIFLGCSSGTRDSSVWVLVEPDGDAMVLHEKPPKTHSGRGSVIEVPIGTLLTEGDEMAVTGDSDGRVRADAVLEWTIVDPIAFARRGGMSARRFRTTRMVDILELSLLRVLQSHGADVVSEYMGNEQVSSSVQETVSRLVATEIETGQIGSLTYNEFYGFSVEDVQVQLHITGARSDRTADRPASETRKPSSGSIVENRTILVDPVVARDAEFYTLSVEYRVAENGGSDTVVELAIETAVQEMGVEYDRSEVIDARGDSSCGDVEEWFLLQVQERIDEIYAEQVLSVDPTRETPSVARIYCVPSE